MEKGHGNLQDNKPRCPKDRNALQILEIANE